MRSAHSRRLTRGRRTSRRVSRAALRLLQPQAWAKQPPSALRLLNLDGGALRDAGVARDRAGAAAAAGARELHAHSNQVRDEARALAESLEAQHPPCSISTPTLWGMAAPRRLLDCSRATQGARARRASALRQPHRPHGARLLGEAAQEHPTPASSTNGNNVGDWRQGAGGRKSTRARSTRSTSTRPTWASRAPRRSSTRSRRLQVDPAPRPRARRQPADQGRDAEGDRRPAWRSLRRDASTTPGGRASSSRVAPTRASCSFVYRSSV